VSAVPSPPPLRVLALDTSTEACSAALLLPDGQVLARETLTDRSHAELILPMIDSLLAEAGLLPEALHGLAFGRGPGGFTGVRVAAGVAQGLAYGAGLPVAPVSSLAAVAAEVAWSRGSDAGVLVCNDARMGELYHACYRFEPEAPLAPVEVTPERVGPPATIVVPPGCAHCAGNGLPRHPELLARLAAAGLLHHAGVYPRAATIARLGAAVLANGRGVPASEALPVYVRDDVARPAGPAVTGMS
jgi:tRNA threonylcarbamoyladenosine biosynthesis protein TsaB